MSTETGLELNMAPAEKTANRAENSAICNFKPDYDLSTPQAQQWHAESQKQRLNPVELDQDGRYTVKWGDSLSTIAERTLKTAGLPVDKDSLKSLQNAIVDANRDEYKTLDCNRDFIKEKWSLKIPVPGQRVEAQPPVVEAPPPEPEPIPEPERLPEPVPIRPIPERPPIQIEPEIMEQPCPPQRNAPVIYNGPGGVVNIFMGNQREHQPQDFTRQYDIPAPEYRPEIPYRQEIPTYRPPIQQDNYYRQFPEYEPYQGQGRNCDPCQTRQYTHNGRIPAHLRGRQQR
ncbi:MAG: hypothetical protein IAF58_18925 [Leptolyngbya sp.]|nr:hypothetical protein [Candidatus Melainabacteria bacterium]